MNYELAALALFGIIGGCNPPSGDLTPIAGQDRAVDFIWRTSYKQTKAPPAIYWRRDRCNSPNGIYGVFPSCTFIVGGEEVAGAEIDTGQWVEVGAPSDGFGIADTAIAHELLHAAIGDTNHTSPAWGHVSDVDQALRAAGL